MAESRDIKDVQLSNLVRKIGADGRTVTLLVKRANEKAIIFFQDGEAVHAVSATELDGLEYFLVGDEAFTYVLGWANGTFSVLKDASNLRRTITKPWEQLIKAAKQQAKEEPVSQDSGAQKKASPPAKSEKAKEKRVSRDSGAQKAPPPADIEKADEQRVSPDSDAQEAPPPADIEQVNEQPVSSPDSDDQKTLSPVDIERDEALENDLITLISILEYKQSQLAAKKNRNHPDLALKLLEGMVNDVVANAEMQLDMEKKVYSLDNILGKTGDMYPAAQYLQVKDNRLSVETFVGKYHNLRNRKSSREQMFQEVIDGILNVMNAYFEDLFACFCSPDIGGQWRETGKVFFKDLKQITEQIKL